MADLSVKILGRLLKNPVMNASGTLGYGNEIEPFWGVETMGCYVTKGLSIMPHHGNPPPRVWEEKCGMINSIGLQNIGIDRFFDEHFGFFRQKRTPIIVNFFGFTDDEYIRCAERIRPDEYLYALEINLSCPNIKAGGISFGKDPKTVYGLIKRLKGVTEIPMLAKLTAEVNDIVEVAQAAMEAGVDGLTLINTIPAITIDINKGYSPIRGGLSGPAIRPIALRAVSECAKKIDLPIIGAGGIMDSEDAIAFFMAGAKAIQVGTASFVDPFAIPKIIKGIEGFMERYGYNAIEDLRGLANDR
jgi:dihydroorotate dehydrogenase (NAD+) catalytic subunit